jgi:hypothetical protein
VSILILPCQISLTKLALFALVSWDIKQALASDQVFVDFLNLLPPPNLDNGTNWIVIFPVKIEEITLLPIRVFAVSSKVSPRTKRRRLRCSFGSFPHRSLRMHAVNIPASFCLMGAVPYMYNKVFLST